MNDVQTELKQLRAEVAQLKKLLGEKQQLEQPKSLPDLSRDVEFVNDLARFSDGVLTEKQVRQKYHLFNEATWDQLGKDETLIEAIELERTRRVRSGATKRELAQNHIVRGPDILNTIMSDPKANAKHKVDAIKTLDALSGNTPEATESERVIVTITLSADEKLTFGGSVKPNPNDSKVIDAVPGFMISERTDGNDGNPL